MSENQEISVAFSSIMDLMTPIYLNTVDGKQYVVFSTEIAVPAEEFPLMLELINAKRVTLKVTSSP